MTSNTINDAVTMAGNAEGTLLAGRYRVVRQLGQGGMGSVWLAEDTQLDNKPFAVKTLPSILVSNKRAYRQLKDEALVAMQLVHPNIVQIRAFEENNGNPFLVMDYIDGETLDDHLAEVGNGEWGTYPPSEASRRRRCPSRGGNGGRGGLPEDEVIRILKPIAAALDYAHGECVVHRDVKPANVMIRKDGHPFILDFGIAREIQETMTRVTGKLSSGTLLYMSPEQLNGEPPKPAQDVYSFAAMVYECLKGEPPFVRGAIEDQIKNKVPESPEGASVPLAHSVMAGLAKKPEDRPSSCVAVLGGSAGRVEHSEPNPGKFGRMLVVVAVLAIFAAGGYCGWVRYERGVQDRIAKEDAERKAKEAAERKAKEAADRKAKEENEREAKEVAELEIARTKIAGKVELAELKVREAEKYRGDPVGFENHLASLDAAAEKLKNIPVPKTAAEANDILKSVGVADGTISSELNWFVENQPRREAARRIEDEMKSGLDAELVRFEVSAIVAGRYSQGQALRRDGNAALRNGDFPLAKENLAEAKAKLTEALAEAKAIREKQQLAKAARIAAEEAEAESKEREEAARKEREAELARERELEQLQKLREEIARLKSSAGNVGDKSARAAIPSDGERKVSLSGRSSVRFTEEDADTLSFLKFSSPVVRAYYEMACKLAREGAHNKARVKTEYNTGRMCGGPRWPELEAWLDWWK